MRQKLLTIFLIVGTITCSEAQIFDKVKKTVNKVGQKISLKKLTQDPISTSFSDVDTQTIQPTTMGSSATYQNIHNQPFDRNQGFLLSPGYYEATFQSFCIKAGTRMPSKGSGRFYAEIKGPKSDIFETILNTFHSDRSITQKEVQLLLWAIIAKTDFQKMKGPAKETALKILSAREIARLSKGALDNFVNKKIKDLAYKNEATRAIIEAENNLRAKYYQGANTYADFEEIALISGLDPIVSGFEEGKWTQHPDGYYIRYFPTGYAKTRTQIHVPKEAGNVYFNAHGDIAVPAHTSSQRLLQTNIPSEDDTWSYEDPTVPNPPTPEPPTSEPPASEPPASVPPASDPSDPQNTNTVTLPCDIDSDLTLVNGPSEVDYRIDCVIDVTATLNIEPGVVIEFGEHAGMGVYDQGQLNINGTLASKVILRGEQKSSGFWRGIHIQSNSTINNAVIQHAGSGYVYCCNEKASILGKNADLTINNTIIEQGAACGIYVDDGLNLSTNDLVINSHDGDDYCYSSPEVLPRDIDQNRVLKNSPRPVDYIVEDGVVVDVTALLNIEPGVVIEFGEHAGMGVFDQGELNIDGTLASKVILRGEQKSSGFWRGIHIQNNSTINNAVIQHAGSGYVYCCNEKASILGKNADLTINNTIIEQGAACGIYVDDGLNLSTNALKIFSHDGDDYCYSSPEVLPRDIDQNRVLKNSPRPVDYIVEDGVVVDVTAILNIEPGVVIEFGANAGMGVFDQGKLIVNGTAANQVIFKGKVAQKGYWRGIHLQGIEKHIISKAQILDTGSSYVYCCNEKAAILLKGSLDIDNTTIANSEGCGIYILSNANLNDSNITFSNNTDGDLCSE